ncbi:MAG TPA: SMP-30/gluconolactonase/LRE family protein [Pseudolysinimonas sp.]|nr:SMP-30/gluconolactonase/LRE family protein [Pseudolysinimonas sp.]
MSISPTSAPRPADAEINILAEGPVWDPLRAVLHWVDIRRGIVFTGELTDDARIEVVDRVEFPGQVGAIAVAETGDWLLAIDAGLVRRSAAGILTAGPAVLPADSGRRLNDGKPDPAGRFVVGSLALLTPSDAEVLVRVEDDGTLSTIDADLTLSNGLAWTLDGATMYSVDTLRSVIYQRSYDARTGATGARAVFADVADGHPDGICLDAEGHLWVAVWGGGRVDRYAPDGRLVASIPVPALHVSSVAFAGDDLQTLVITTATQDLDDDTLSRFPDSGRLFTCLPGVQGAQPALWNGLLGQEGSRP